MPNCELSKNVCNVEIRSVDHDVANKPYHIKVYIYIWIVH